MQSLFLRFVEAQKDNGPKDESADHIIELRVYHWNFAEHRWRKKGRKLSEKISAVDLGAHHQCLLCFTFARFLEAVASDL